MRLTFATLALVAVVLACTEGNFSGRSGAVTPKRDSGNGEPGKGAEDSSITVPVGDTTPAPVQRDHGKIISAKPKDPSIATLDPETGVITGEGVGKTTIDVVFEDGTKATITVTVTDPGSEEDLGKPGEAETDTSTVDQPSGLLEENGELVAKPDLNACAALPEAGKQNYGGNPKCPEDSVVVIVNDGKAPELTCCPVAGKNILSAKPEDRYQPRQGSCNAGEVVVGMTSPSGPSLFCSKLNDGLELGSKVSSIYAKNTNLSPIYARIAAGYNVNDTCICPEGTVYVGEHTTQDNVCIDKCAKITKKKK